MWSVSHRSDKHSWVSTVLFTYIIHFLIIAFQCVREGLRGNVSKWASISDTWEGSEDGNAHINGCIISRLSLGIMARLLLYTRHPSHLNRILYHQPVTWIYLRVVKSFKTGCWDKTQSFMKLSCCLADSDIKLRPQWSQSVSCLWSCWSRIYNVSGKTNPWLSNCLRTQSTREICVRGVDFLEKQQQLAQIQSAGSLGEGWLLRLPEQERNTLHTYYNVRQSGNLRGKRWRHGSDCALLLSHKLPRCYYCYYVIFHSLLGFFVFIFVMWLFL